MLSAAGPRLLRDPRGAPESRHAAPFPSLQNGRSCSARPERVGLSRLHTGLRKATLRCRPPPRLRPRGTQGPASKWRRTLGSGCKARVVERPPRVVQPQLAAEWQETGHRAEGPCSENPATRNRGTGDSSLPGASADTPAPCRASAPGPFLRLWACLAGAFSLPRPEAGTGPCWPCGQLHGAQAPRVRGQGPHTFPPTGLFPHPMCVLGQTVPPPKNYQVRSLTSPETQTALPASGAPGPPSPVHAPPPPAHSRAPTMRPRTLPSVPSRAPPAGHWPSGPPRRLSRGTSGSLSPDLGSCVSRPFSLTRPCVPQGGGNRVLIPTCGSPAPGADMPTGRMNERGVLAGGGTLHTKHHGAAPREWQVGNCKNGKNSAEM